MHWLEIMISKEIVIVGAGGFAKEILGYIDFDNAQGSKIKIKGIIDDDASKMSSMPSDVKYLGGIESYHPSSEELLLVCLGANPTRKKIINMLISKGASFFSYISSLAYVNASAKLGDGIFIAPFCMVNANVSLGDHALLNSYSAIGHDCTIGQHAILYPYAAINGSCQVGSDLVMGTRSTIFPGVTIGNNCTITTHSYVKNNKGDNRFIHQKAKEMDLENRL